MPSKKPEKPSKPKKKFTGKINVRELTQLHGKTTEEHFRVVASKFLAETHPNWHKIEDEERKILIREKAIELMDTPEAVQSVSGGTLTLDHANALKKQGKKATEIYIIDDENE
ncbi:MAG: hypothetical protein GOV15_01985 [Candidatus Diapherotrites archaeon]|nr:hypothetical protein [Candidatus Diapherotrites archaeon]